MRAEGEVWRSKYTLFFGSLTQILTHRNETRINTDILELQPNYTKLTGKNSQVFCSV